MAAKWELNDVQVGDALFVTGGHFGRAAKRTVARVTKTFVEDDRGGKWTMRGNQYGHGRDAWMGPSARPWVDGEDDEIIAELREQAADKKRVARLGAIKWRDVDRETAKKVVAALAGLGVLGRVVRVVRIDGGDPDGQLLGALDVLEAAGVAEDRWPKSMDEFVGMTGTVESDSGEDLTVVFERWPEAPLAFEESELEEVL